MGFLLGHFNFIQGKKKGFAVKSWQVYIGVLWCVNSRCVVLWIVEAAQFILEQAVTTQRILERYLNNM